MFGEDQEPLSPAREMIGNDGAEFLELGFGDVLFGVLCQPNEAVKFLDLGLQLGHVLGHREPLDDIILEVPTLGFGQIVQIFGQFAKLLLELAELCGDRGAVLGGVPRTGGSPPGWRPGGVEARSGPGRRCGSRPAPHAGNCFGHIR